MQGKMPRLPNNSQRIAIVGRTGTGKTIAAMWHLSKRDFDKMPWIVYDFKSDEHINSIEKAVHVDTDFVPSKKDRGIFIVHPSPHETEEVTKQMWEIWHRENCGIYVDEGYMVGQDNPAFDACLTQGRSKRIPMIILSQRPVWMSRFVFSEADFYQVFSLNDKRDKKTIAEFTPCDFATRLPDYHSYYYDVGRDSLFMFSPVPNESEILKTIDAKLSNRKRFL